MNALIPLLFIVLVNKTLWNYYFTSVVARHRWRVSNCSQDFYNLAKVSICYLDNFSDTVNYVRALFLDRGGHLARVVPGGNNSRN